LKGKTAVALVIDIETTGQAPEKIPDRALAYLFRQLEKEQLNDEELEIRRKDIIGRFSLDPTVGTIICIGLVDTDTGEEKAIVDLDEKVLLGDFWQFLRTHQPELFVTFNGKSFDFPYINVRSAILQVPPSMILPIRRHTTHPHFDVREVFAGNERYRRGNLDYFCAVFGIDSPKQNMDGKRVGTAYRQGRIEEIALYCLGDCRATAALYERLKSFYQL
jgi:predicted PolB exonuclease-like 3'-5' exonuclease